MFFFYCWETDCIYHLSFQRCLGMRFLHPVYCIPEVELRPGKFTNLRAIEYCKQHYFSIEAVPSSETGF